MGTPFPASEFSNNHHDRHNRHGGVDVLARVWRLWQSWRWLPTIRSPETGRGVKSLRPIAPDVRVHNETRGHALCTMAPPLRTRGHKCKSQRWLPRAWHKSACANLRSDETSSISGIPRRRHCVSSCLRSTGRWNTAQTIPRLPSRNASSMRRTTFAQTENRDEFKGAAGWKCTDRCPPWIRSAGKSPVNSGLSPRRNKARACLALR